MLRINRALSRFVRPFSSGAPKPVTVQIPNSFTTHLLEKPAEVAETNRDEMLSYLKLMLTMRRMEITCDTEYKARNIRGFCHLYDGQEAIATGIQNSLVAADAWTTSYRCHCVALVRGGSVETVIAELFGFAHGMQKGKGGSMHFYSKKHNFYGGHGIVGAQVPLGAGLAFAQKYEAPEGGRMNVSLVMFGDGAANQGQIWEAANMAKLWNLPLILVIENNQYGMGTAINRSSCNTKYYTQGNVIPGIKIDGMNVLAVREGTKFAREHCASGKGPIFIEYSTYRYHGHSMSDPGTTYRTRDEVQNVRTSRDPIDYAKKVLTDFNLATADEIKEVEKDVRNEVQEALKRAKAGSFPPLEELHKYVYADEHGNNAQPALIRMPDNARSIIRNL